MNGAAAGVAAVQAVGATTTPHDVGFGLMVGGAFAVWVGAGNFVTRRLAARRWGELGSNRAFWFRFGFFFAPDWVSIPILVCGLVSLLAGVVVSVLA